MSIFNRLITSLKGSEEAPVAATPREPAASRFMGREQAEEAAAPVVKRLNVPGMIWVHIQPVTQRLLLVSELGVAKGEDFTQSMLDDLQRAGWCEEVAYHASYDQYWKMPTQEAILRMPALYNIPMPLLNRIKLSSKLVKQGEARGFWMRVRMRAEDELQDNASSSI